MNLRTQLNHRKTKLEATFLKSDNVYRISLLYITNYNATLIRAYITR